MLQLRLLYAAAVLMLLPAMVGPVVAQNIPTSKIYGTWCGTVTNYTFTRDSITVFWHDAGQSRKFVVTRIERHPEFLNVHWVRNGEPQNTIFGAFTADGQRMVQLPNTYGDMGPARLYRRC